jgi:hypothetical protein
MSQSIKQIEAKIGTLSNPDKMPAYSWGISAKRCITGTKLANQDGTVCSKCYANKGCYVFQVVQDAQEFRYHAIEKIEWVDYMTELLTRKYKNLDKSRLFHRWFDSGDLQSLSHLMKIIEVCEHTPHIKHWLATREASIVSQIKESDVPKNLIIRVSATKVDGKPPKFWKWTSSVHKDRKAIGHACPSQYQDNKCGSCRKCWDRRTKNVSYEEH